MQVAALHLEAGNQKDCKKLLEEGKSTLDSMTDVDPTVHASFYWISSQYHKSRQEFAEFYKSALLYLAYTSVESLSESFKLVLFPRPSLVGFLPKLLQHNLHPIKIQFNKNLPFYFQAHKYHSCLRIVVLYYVVKIDSTFFSDHTRTWHLIYHLRHYLGTTSTTLASC